MEHGIEQKNVLICLLGISPLVVTEAIDGLQLNEGYFIDTLHVIHTGSDRIVSVIPTLMPEIMKRVSENTEVIFHQMPFDDIYSELEDREFMARTWRVIVNEKKRGNHVLISIAGGRKTMSASGLFAAYLGGADGILHVVLKDEGAYLPAKGYPPRYDVPLDQIQFIKVPVVNMYPLIKNLATTIAGSANLEDQLMDGDVPLDGIFNDLTAKLEQWSLRDALRNEYEKRHERYERMVVLTSTVLQAIMGIHEVPVDITRRVKTFDSILRKIDTDGIRFRAADVFFDKPLMNDIAGCSVICYYQDDVEKTIQLLQASDDFEVLGIKSLAKENGYHALHVDVRFTEKRLSDVEYRFVRGIVCEIQIRTAMHQAWYRPNHWIYYKSKAYELAALDQRERVNALFKKAGELVIQADLLIASAKEALIQTDENER